MSNRTLDLSRWDKIDADLDGMFVRSVVCPVLLVIESESLHFVTCPINISKYS